MTLGLRAQTPELLQLRPGVYQTTTPDGRGFLVAGPYTIGLGPASTALDAVLRRLAERPRDPAELFAAAPGSMDGEPVELLVDRLRRHGWLAMTITRHGVPLYTVVPLRPSSEFTPVPERTRLVLSRFALIRAAGDSLVLESPRAWCDIRVHDAAMLAALTDPDAAVPERLRQDLWWAGMLVSEGSEDTELRVRQWSPHELWFHTRSRIDDHRGLGERFGGTYWAKDTFAPPPARPPEYPGVPVELYRPDLESLRRTDPALTAVLEDRRSVRDHTRREPLGLDQVGEFLYRCARTRRTTRWDGVELTDRPYPSGGSLHELELYPLLRQVTGAEPGLYHYDSHGHRLRLVRDLAHPAVRRLLRDAARSSASPIPQSLIVIGFRCGRLMWKYEAIPYALALKNLGALYQTMYCVATAMGVAACALGAGDATAFTEATGRDPLEECGVGEFMLGGSEPAHESRS
jgi:SagB-type dehydrogenase family enzyme